MARADAWLRSILHVDMDAFFTSIHQRDDPRLRGVPLVVAGNSRRSVVAGASYEARVFGIHSAMPLYRALELCPTLQVVSPDRDRYREASRKVHAVLRRYAPAEKVESMSIDEAYLDLTARTRHGTTHPEDLARRIKYDVREEVGLTCSVGVATSKMVAKVASGYRKPDGLTVVPPGTEADFLRPLPLAVMPGLGEKLGERFALMGIRTLGDLADQDPTRLAQVLGLQAALFQRMAQGRDRTPVDGSRPVRSISAETTFEQDIVDRSQLERELWPLAARVTERLQADGLRARTIKLKLKPAGAPPVTRQVSRRYGTAEPAMINAALAGLFEAMAADGRPVRLIGVALGGLESGAVEQQQLDLFGPAGG